MKLRNEFKERTKTNQEMKKKTKHKT